MPKASNTGQILEKFVASLLLDNDYHHIKPAKTFLAMRELGHPIFAQQFTVGESIYKKPRKVDFILYHPELWVDCLVIECKWQASAGSVDEKYPFLVENIEYGDYPTIVILDGGGYTEAASEWLRSRSGTDKFLYVFNQGEFQRFVSRGMI